LILDLIWKKHLNFFVDCRRAFANLDYVKSQLVIGVCNLAMKALRIIKGKHNPKTAAFVRACVAYCFITIPSMEDVLQQLNLYLLAGTVALQNQALPQADGLFRSAIKLIQEVPPRIEIDQQIRSTHDSLVSFLNTFVASLVFIPGHPEHGPFYLVTALIKVISEYGWDTSSSSKISVFFNILSLMSTYKQNKFPYHLANVESNDLLYGGDEKYLNELQTIIDKLVEQILEDLAKFSENEDVNAKRIQ